MVIFFTREKSYCQMLIFTRLIFWRRRGVRWQREAASPSLIGLIVNQYICAGFDWLEVMTSRVGKRSLIRLLEMLNSVLLLKYICVIYKRK